jgi:RIO kinase 1
MKIPKRIESLIEEGLVDSVICQLMSGKEAMVYVVRCGDSLRCAKVYKETNQRSFHKNTDYTDGRRTKSSRRGRSIEKGGRHGRKEREDEWQSAEVDALYRLARGGVRVPQPYAFFGGVLLMELITDMNGDVAPKMHDLELTAEQAREYHQILIRQAVRMLCAGIVHGDLSQYNVLIGNEGPVVIDLPQAIDAAGNNNAGSMFKRDIDNLTTYLGRFAPDLRQTDYGSEIWSLYQNGRLHPETELTGQFKHREKPADVGGVMRVVHIILKREAALQRHAQQFSY